MGKNRRELGRDLQEKLGNLPPADWVLEMREHYHRTGSYPREHLRRLLGDPVKGVEFGPNTSIADQLAGLSREKR